MRACRAVTSPPQKSVVWSSLPVPAFDAGCATGPRDPNASTRSQLKFRATTVVRIWHELWGRADRATRVWHELPPASTGADKPRRDFAPGLEQTSGSTVGVRPNFGTTSGLGPRRASQTWDELLARPRRSLHSRNELPPRPHCPPQITREQFVRTLERTRAEGREVRSKFGTNSCPRPSNSFQT